MGVDPQKFLKAALPSRPAGAPIGDTIVQLADWRMPLQSLVTKHRDDDVRESAHRLFKIRFADSEGRRRSANVLLERRYAWRGYNVNPAPTLGSSRVTFSAFDEDAVIATISVGVDGASGLFVEGLFRSEIATLRSRRARVCEFTKLAIDGAVRSKTLIASMFHIAYIHARRLNACTDLLVEVNPRHVKFYERMLGFTVLGVPRMDPRIDAAATLLHLDLAHAEREIARVGGNAPLGATMRSLYPFFFAPDVAADIEFRLRRAC